MNFSADKYVMAFSYLLAEKVSCLAMFSKKAFAIVSNLRFISRKHFMLSWAEHEKSFIISGSGLLNTAQLLNTRVFVKQYNTDKLCRMKIEQGPKFPTGLHMHKKKKNSSACSSTQADQYLRCPPEDTLDTWLPTVPCEDWSDCVDAQADLSLPWAHMIYCRKCVPRLNCFQGICKQALVCQERLLFYYNHYENTPIQIYSYWKFHHKKKKKKKKIIFRQKILIFFIFLLKT